ncbi:MAG: HetP family heterocyst commitment protein [Pseudanabaena sp. CRU_2_10]|nr:HetP family heterocyst commitment protein [Pseudanabaena sp. CRU_2_10]
MNNLSLNKTKLDKAMDPEQFNQVIEAILDGKYSWACVLILRFAGYNPLHYIPYRTYNRLSKDNGSARKSASQLGESLNNVVEAGCGQRSSERNLQTSRQSLGEIQDLSYQELVNEQSKCLHGGINQDNWLRRQFQEYISNSAWIGQSQHLFSLYYKSKITQAGSYDYINCINCKSKLRRKICQSGNISSNR